MVRKIFSYLLVITTLMTSAAMPAFAEDTVSGSAYEPTAKESMLVSLGIIDSTDYNGNEKMTRGEFAVLLANTLNLDIEDEAVNAGGVPEVNDSEIVNPVSSVFKDVDTSSEEYGAIMAVYKNGYMSGASEELFAPEYNLVLSDTIIISENQGRKPE